MCKLKAIESATAVIENVYLVYRKSEADKVIAEKDAEIARLKDIRKVHVEAIESMGAGLLQDNDEIRHQKFKRCLANAAKYLWKRNYWRDSIPAYERQRQWENMAYKHYKRWLELAEQFKDKKA